MAMKTLRVISVGLTLLTVFGCGNVGDGVDLLRMTVDRFGPTESRASSTARSLPRATIDAAAVPLILVELPDRGASATMLSIGANRGVTSWAGGDGVGLSLMHPGLVISTRGYGGDILSSDVSAALEVLDQPVGATATRTLRYLDGQNRDYTRSYYCEYFSGGAQNIEIFEVIHRTEQVVEQCRATDHSFENQYWIDGEGLIWKSVQFAGASIGYLHIERLHR